jgi:hypothetical protein
VGDAGIEPASPSLMCLSLAVLKAEARRSAEDRKGVDCGRPVIAQKRQESARSRASTDARIERRDGGVLPSPGNPFRSGLRQSRHSASTETC